MSIPMLYDLYALCDERSLLLANRFLDEWAPRREWSAAEIAVPIGSDRLFSPADAALAALVAEPASTQTMYWRTRRDDHIEHVMLGFSCDGRMIAGLSAWFDEPLRWPQPRDPTVRGLTDLLAHLARSVEGRFGYVTFEEPPLEDGTFIEECRRRELAMIEGIIPRQQRSR
jgi:hypothetical protein